MLGILKQYCSDSFGCVGTTAETKIELNFYESNTENKKKINLLYCPYFITEPTNFRVKQ